MNLVALGLFVTALVAFGTFHFADWHEVEHSPGYYVWPEVAEMISTRNFGNPRESIGLLMFPCFALLAIGSPFLIGILNRSRIAWWLLVLSSGCCMIAIGAFMVAITQGVPGQRGTGFFCLAAALALNFLGMLFVRPDERVRFPGDTLAGHGPCEERH